MQSEITDNEDVMEEMFPNYFEINQKSQVVLKSLLKILTYDIESRSTLYIYNPYHAIQKLWMVESHSIYEQKNICTLWKYCQLNTTK